MREIRIDERDLTRGKKDAQNKQLRDVQVPSREIGFQVNHIDDYDTSNTREARGTHNEDVEEIIVEEREPGEQVRVKFDKFVQLVATHNFEEVLKEHANEDIIMNSNLLMDLASAHEDDQPEDPKRQPMLIGVGVVIGIVLAYIAIQVL